MRSEMPIPIIHDEYGCKGLDCPHCGGNYLHHHGITYYNRSEDAERGDLVKLNYINADDQWSFDVSHQTNASMRSCPSPRRGGMEILFNCECCSAISSLAVYQHKGQTYIEWYQIELPEPEPEPVKRKPIKPSLRFDILKRDDYRCQMCGATAKDGAKLEVDHITPVAKGGSNDADNLQVLCRDCNAGKSDSWE